MFCQFLNQFFSLPFYHFYQISEAEMLCKYWFEFLSEFYSIFILLLLFDEGKIFNWITHILVDNDDHNDDVKPSNAKCMAAMVTKVGLIGFIGVALISGDAAYSVVGG